MNYAVTFDIPVSVAIITFDGITEGGGCCALCFDMAGCILFWLNSSGQCVLNIATGNAEGNITPRCPLGTVSTSVAPPVAGLSPAGLGPCTTPYN